MSEVYIKEPATKGGVLLHTTHGDLEIELWATECPKACRNFCQLILEGYYNDTVFHRVIKDFIIQGGDKTGTGEGSESVFGEPYPDEIHPRLKFRYRGMMGIASAGKGTKTNGSQFFIVLNRAPTLDGKHTLFGKVIGKTIYNLVRLTEVEVDKNDCPVDPPKILRAELTWDPFGDLEPRFTAPIPQPRKGGQEKHRREAIKNKKVLSFGADEEEEDSDDEAAPAFGKARSAHDVLTDPKLSKDAAYAVPSAPSKPKTSKAGSTKEEAPKKRSAPAKGDSSEEAAPAKSSGPPAKAARRKAAESDEEEADFAAEEKKEDSSDDDSSSSSGGKPSGKKADPSQKRNSEIDRLKLEIAAARKGEAPAPVKQKKKSAWEELLSNFKTRGQGGAGAKAKDKKGRQAQTENLLDGLQDFKGRVREVAKDKSEADSIDPEVKKRKEAAEDGSLASVWEEGDEESASDWLSGGGLSFDEAKAKAFKLARTSKATLEIFDPLAAKSSAEVLEAERKRRSDQLKPSIRRSGLDSRKFEERDLTPFGNLAEINPWQFGQKK